MAHLRTVFVYSLLLMALTACTPFTGLPKQASNPNSGAEHCPPRQNDTTGYLTTICMYIYAKQIDVSPARPAEYEIKRIEEQLWNGRPAVWVFLNCCYLGDIAIMDKDSGAVLDFRPGPH